jgi:hypothetical protein
VRADLSLRDAGSGRCRAHLREDGFLDGSTQKKVMQYLDQNLLVYDGRNAFANHDAKVGSFFVYNAGDKIDWNHPNRSGHAALAKGFSESKSCPVLKADTQG